MKGWSAALEEKDRPNLRSVRALLTAAEFVAMKVKDLSVVLLERESFQQLFA